VEEKEENVEEKAKKGAEEEREVDWREKQIEDSFRFRGKKRNFMVSAITGHVSSGTLTGATPQLVTNAEDGGGSSAASTGWSPVFSAHQTADDAASSFRQRVQTFLQLRPSPMEESQLHSHQEQERCASTTHHCGMDYLLSQQIPYMLEDDAALKVPYMLEDDTAIKVDAKLTPDSVPELMHEINHPSPKKEAEQSAVTVGMDAAHATIHDASAHLYENRVAGDWHREAEGGDQGATAWVDMDI